MKVKVSKVTEGADDSEDKLITPFSNSHTIISHFDELSVTRGT